MKRTLLIALAAALSLAATLMVGNAFFFENSIHKTRAGKAFWYAAENGGFENVTNIPMEDLSCLNCHAATKADGTPIDAETYDPDCADCHVFPGDTPDQSICLGCHSRQGAEISLAANPTLGPLFTDVHRDGMNMTCVDCHTSEEMHGDDPVPHSMFDAQEITCETCHEPSGLEQNTAHATHMDDVYCSSCHVKTVIACFNCHFETEVEADKKRFYGGPPFNDFLLLVNDDRTGKVHPATYQSVTWGDNTFWAIGPYAAHTVTAEARTCTECHNSPNVQALTTEGTLAITTWDAGQSILTNTKGVIPLPEDWETSITMDFVRFKGDPTDPVNNPRDPSEWEFMETGPDTGQLLFATPLTQDQMDKLAADVTAVDDAPAVPARFELLQNYPNPFNPSTMFAFKLRSPATVSLNVYNLVGEQVATVFSDMSFAAGEHEIPWRASGLASGVYIYRLEGDGLSVSKPMTLLR